MKKKQEKSTSSKSYWLYLHPYVQVFQKKNRSVLYNTLNGKLLNYDNTKIFSIIKRLNSDSNLYVIKIKEKEIDTHVNQFINNIRHFFMGDFINISNRSHKPIQLKPILNLQKTFDYMTISQGESKILVKDEIKDYLNEITLYINDKCDQKCPMCTKSYKQFSCCFKNKSGETEVNTEDINKLLNEVKNSKIYKLNILGGNIFRHSKLIEILEILNHTYLLKEYYVHYLNIEYRKDFFKLLLAGDNRLNVIIHFPCEINLFDSAAELLSRDKINKKFYFVVEKDNDIIEAEGVISKFQIKDFELIPYYNDTNLDFFKRNVFLNIESIIEVKPTMNEIFTRMTVNTAFFKKLVILSNKEVYSCLCHPKIGKWGMDYIFDLIYKELHRGKSWTKIRKNVIPCKSCVFNALCPPISNYEYAIGRYNLCNIM